MKKFKKYSDGWDSVSSSSLPAMFIGGAQGTISGSIRTSDGFFLATPTSTAAAGVGTAASSAAGGVDTSSGGGGCVHGRFI